ncbi:hypothetical protein QQ045_027144 [Rhodiola kirilowii]
MWEHSNRMSLRIIHRGIPEAFRGIVPDEISSAKDYLAEFENRFVENDKAKTKYSQLRISYNCQREKWTLNELISFCVEEEEMLKHDEAANSKVPVFSTHITCHFCEKTGHVKKKCSKWAKYIAWRVKRGLYDASIWE